jgi:hypothetical protein
LDDDEFRNLLGPRRREADERIKLYDKLFGEGGPPGAFPLQPARFYNGHLRVGSGPILPPVDFRDPLSREIDARMAKTADSPPPPVWPNFTSILAKAPAGRPQPVSRRPQRDAAIKALLAKGLSPGQDIPWKVFCDEVRRAAGVTAEELGYSNERIEKVTRKIKRLLRGARATWGRWQNDPK